MYTYGYHTLHIPYTLNGPYLQNVQNGLAPPEYRIIIKRYWSKTFYIYVSE